MITLKNSRLFVATLFALILGAFFYVKATDKKTPTPTKKILEYVYFQFDSSGQPMPITDLDQNTHEEGSNPYNCPNATGPVCSSGYAQSDLEQDANGDWVPKSTATPHDIRRYSN